MSAQFGRWNLDGEPVDTGYLERVRSLIAPYGPDGGDCYSKPGISILYRAFHTTNQSRHETQPHPSASGAILTLDGRLDNRDQLIRQLSATLEADATDVEIVAAAYERWAAECFARLIGDWALSIWEPNERSLILAKDPVGTRHLHYSLDERQVSWSTILDPLVLLADRSFELDEEYIAGWLSSFPAVHLTPYVGIHSVPPSSFVIVRDRKLTVRKYWDFDPGKKVRYRTDGEYEEHFRITFTQSVWRRLRSDTPVVAELSGGMDSSSIVCMADAAIRTGAAEAPALDTLSYYSDDEPSWNDRQYFAKIEAQRGRTGCHINVGEHRSLDLQFHTEEFMATPGSGHRPTPAAKQFAQCMASHHSRVLLSGTGGDEVTGGAPTPTPELADLLATLRLRQLAHQLKAWALSSRKPWFHLLLETGRRFFPPALVGAPKHRQPPAWLHPGFVKRHPAALIGYERRLNLFGPLPSFQDNLGALEALRRQVGCSALPSGPPYEKRYPYLDRDLLEFLYAIPREQLVRPGQRRSLMRRALVGIVPDEILNRKRKAFVSRGHRVAIASQWARLIETSQNMVSSSRGILDTASYCEALEKARSGKEVPIVPLLRAIGIEMWLRNLAHSDLSHTGQRGTTDRPLRLARNESLTYIQRLLS